MVLLAQAKAAQGGEEGAKAALEEAEGAVKRAEQVGESRRVMEQCLQSLMCS